jgi:hypothetical protein
MTRRPNLLLNRLKADDAWIHLTHQFDAKTTCNDALVRQSDDC